MLCQSKTIIKTAPNNIVLLHFAESRRTEELNVYGVINISCGKQSLFGGNYCNEYLHFYDEDKVRCMDNIVAIQCKCVLIDIHVAHEPTKCIVNATS